MRFIYIFLFLIINFYQIIGAVEATTYPVPYNQYNQSPYMSSVNQPPFNQNASSLNPFMRQKPPPEKTTFHSEKMTTTQSDMGATCPRPTSSDEGPQCKLNRGGRGPDDNQIPQIVDYVNRMNDDLNQLKISYIPSILHNVDGLDGKLRKLELDLRRFSEDLGNVPSPTDLKILRDQIRELRGRLHEQAASDLSPKTDPVFENRLNDLENQLRYLKGRTSSFQQFNHTPTLRPDQVSSIVENMVDDRFRLIDRKINMIAQSHAVSAVPSPRIPNTYEVSLPPRQVDLRPIYNEVGQLKQNVQRGFQELRGLQQQSQRSMQQIGYGRQELMKLKNDTEAKINVLRHHLSIGTQKPDAESTAKINYALGQINALMKKIGELERLSHSTRPPASKDQTHDDIEKIVNDIVSLQIEDLRSKLKDEWGDQKNLNETDIRTIVSDMLNNRNDKDIFEQLFSTKVKDIIKLVQTEISKVSSLSPRDVKQMIDQALAGIDFDSFRAEMTNNFKGELATLKTEIEFLKASPKGLSPKEIESLVQKMLMNVADKGDLDRLTQKMQTIENQVNTQQLSLTGLQNISSTITELKSQMEAFQQKGESENNFQGQNIRRLEEKLTSLEQMVSELKNAHSRLEVKISELENHSSRLENTEGKINNYDNRLQELEKIVADQGQLIRELSLKPVVSSSIEIPSSSVPSQGFKKGNYEDFYIKTEKPLVGKKLFSPREIERLCRQESFEHCQMVNCPQIYARGAAGFCREHCNAGRLLRDQRENLYKVCMAERLQHQSEGLSPDKRMEWKNSRIPSFEKALHQRMVTEEMRQQAIDQSIADRRSSLSSGNSDIFSEYPPGQQLQKEAVVPQSGNGREDDTVSTGISQQLPPVPIHQSLLGAQSMPEQDNNPVLPDVSRQVDLTEPPVAYMPPPPPPLPSPPRFRTPQKFKASTGQTMENELQKAWRARREQAGTQKDDGMPLVHEDQPVASQMESGEAPIPYAPPPPPMPVQEIVRGRDPSLQDVLAKALKSRRASMENKTYEESAMQENQSPLPSLITEVAPTDIPPAPPLPNEQRNPGSNQLFGTQGSTAKMEMPVSQSGRDELLNQIRQRGGGGLKKAPPLPPRQSVQNLGPLTGEYLSQKGKESLEDVQVPENPHTAATGEEEWVR